MKSELIYTYTRDMTNEDWLKFRKRGFGASEIGAILGLSEYTSALQIFYEKINPSIGYKFENIAMFMGNETESFIGKLHQYWDGDEESMIRNYRNGNIVRRNQRVNAYIQNPKWEHLFVSLDRKINRYKKDGIWQDEEVLEIKNMSGFVKQKWEHGIPPSYMAQVQQQLLVTDLTHGELAIMIDGRNFEVFRFERNDEFCNHIITQSTDLWQRIKKAKSLKTQLYEAELNFNQRLQNEIKEEIINLEPDVNGTISLNDFLNDKYKKGTSGERIGTYNQLEWAKKHKALHEQKKSLETELRMYENKLKNSMKDIEVLNFQDDGKVYWTNTKSGRRYFRNKIK